ncbi:hypothetical protein C7S18_05460 [Ahniella affigens]|uniref:Uncharacterized protein n=1 Tax=Ahniella affigens TaxID=2021234 RepID=A0A2P1PPB4_9GAMM|nr:hypothetical protein C7S18_05460 [Ahniella affigens]
MLDRLDIVGAVEVSIVHARNWARSRLWLQVAPQLSPAIAGERVLPLPREWERAGERATCDTLPL